MSRITALLIIAASTGCLCREPRQIPLERWFSREKWGARAPNGCGFEVMSPGNITIHHTAGVAVHDSANGVVQTRSIQNYHQGSNGWCDVGYHFLVDLAGNIYQGRPFASATTWPAPGAAIPDFIQGAHTGGYNTDNIGISVMANFPTNAVMSRGDTAYETVTLLAATLARAFNMDINDVTLRGHQDWTHATECPGQIHDLLPQLRTDIRARITKLRHLDAL